MSLTIKQQQERYARAAIRKVVTAALAELDKPGGDPLAYIEQIRAESIEKLERELARRELTSGTTSRGSTRLGCRAGETRVDES